MMMTERESQLDHNGSLMDEDESDAIAAYRQELVSLVLNSKPHILMLTMLAEDYKDTKAAEIVDCIEQRLLQVSPDKKLPSLYLIDSICKNLASSAYIGLFQQKIVRLFSHTFELVDDKTRVLLFKLRQTWGEVFTPETLFNLDTTISRSDPNWPVSQKLPIKSTIQNDTNKPKAAPVSSPKSVPIVPSRSDVVKQPFLIQKELPPLERLEMDIHNEILHMSNGQSSSSSSMSRQHESTSKNSKKFSHSSKRKLSSDQNTSPIKKKRDSKDSNDKFPKRTSPLKVCSKSTKKDNLNRKQSKSPLSSKSKKNINEAPIQLPIAPDDVIPLGSSHHTSVAKWSKPDHRHRSDSQSSSVKSRRSRRSRSPLQSTSSSGRNTSRLSPNNESTSSKATMQTTIPAPNVFAQPEMLFNFPKIDKTDHSWNPQFDAGFGMDRDYRREFESFISETQNKLNTGVITSADHELLVRKAKQQFSAMQNNLPGPFGATNTSQFPGIAPPPVSSVIPTQPQLMEPHGSVVLNINDARRRLYYVDSNTAIVLKAPPDTPFDQLVNVEPFALEPKQVCFSGDPTVVYIDPGTPNEQSLRLEFNAPMAATFYLPGVGIPQHIMLGLPARELIINGQPYQIAFGERGPALSVYFECDNKYHQFWLSDSRPRLTFSEEVRYDLWNKLVHDAKQKAQMPLGAPPAANFADLPHVSVPVAQAMPPFAGQSTIPPPISSQFPPFDSSATQMAPVAAVNPPSTAALSDVNSLLSKLSDFGLIPSAAPTAGPSTEQPPSKKVKRARKETGPKKYLPFDVAALKTPHQFAIDQLYSGLQCTNCSLRFSDDALKEENVPGEKTKKSRYARHLDWHFRQNRRDKAKPGSVASSTASLAHRRPWYYTIDLWILYKEVNDDEEDSAGAFDSNAVNSPSMLAANGAFTTFDFSQFKDCIPDFDNFVESINCDNTQESTKQCSVVAESDVGANNCAVCNEAFDLKWYEDEEEWHLMNAVRYNAKGNESEGKIYHPLCLKDHLIQLEKGAEDKNKSMKIDGNESISSRNDESIPATPIEEDIKFPICDKRDVLIPGFEVPIKTEEPEFDESQMENNSDINVKEEMHEAELAQQALDEDDHSGEDINKQAEEHFEVKVIEIEFPIAAAPKSDSSELEEAPKESVATDSVSETADDTTGALSPKRTASSETEQDSPNGKSQVGTAQPKRGGIVIKMKKSTVTSSNSPPVGQAADESGNVLASSDSAIDNSGEPSGLDARPDHISTPNCDNKSNDDVADITTDNAALSELSAGTEPTGDFAPPEGTSSLSGQDATLSPHTDALEQPISAAHSDAARSEGSVGVSAPQEHSPLNGGPDGPSALDAQPPASDAKPAQENYYSRGHETSSLCCIM